MMAPGRRLWLLLAALALLTAAPPLRAQEAGLVTRPSLRDVPGTVAAFTVAVRAAGWVVFTEIDHQAAALAVGQALGPRTVVLFGNPRAGTAAMRGAPTLALDLPMRVLVWQDDAGQTFITRSTGADTAQRVFARHGVVVPPEAQRGADAFIEGLVRQAAE